MRKIVSIFIFGSSLIQYSYAQNASFVWAKQFGGSLGSNGNAVVVDAAGNVYTTGQFKGTADFDPGPGSYNLTTPGDGMFVSKLDSAGHFVWAKQFGGTNIAGYAIAIDTAGNVYTTGFFQHTADFDPGAAAFNLTAANGANIFVSKLDNNGNFVWARKFGGGFNSYATGFGIAVDISGNVYTIGQFDYTVDFDGGPGVANLTANGFEDIFISKLDVDGNLSWVKQIGDNYNETGTAITLDVSGNLLVTGYFQGDVDFDPGNGITQLSAVGSIDIFVAKYDADGNSIWARSMGGTLNDISLSIAVDLAGNVYTTGYFFGTCDFNPAGGGYPLNSFGEADIFVTKLYANGGFAWTKQMGGPNEDRSFGITVDGAGNVYTIGDFQGTADFDPGIGQYNFTSKGGQDIFISKLNNSGNFLWAKRIGSANEDIGYSIKTDTANNIYSTGYFSSTVDFDPGLPVFNLSSYSVNDVFVHKMRKCTNSPLTSATVAACNSYVFNGHTYTTSGTYTDTLFNMGGCDSVVILNLTINGSVTNTTVTVCDSMLWQGQTYLNSGLYSVTYTGAGGCDSVLKLDLTIYHRIFTSINATICQGRNYAGHTSAGTYMDTFLTVHGCDSIRTLFLSIKPSSFSNLSATICDGQFYLGHGNAGIHSDTLVSANGCDSIRILNLTVLPRSFTNISAAICQGQSYYAGGASETNTGIYRDTLTNSIGCDSIITTNLLVHPYPPANLGPDRNLCTNTGAADITPGSFNNYLWQDNSAAASFTVRNAGKYWVTVTDSYGCRFTDSVNISAIDTIPSHFLPPNQDLCYGAVLKIPVPGYQKYKWSTGAVSNNIFVSKAGLYYLIATDNHSCTGADSITIQRKNCIPIGIPNTFTPNADKLNDIFKPTINEAVYQYYFIIFNRFGEQIFQTSEYGKGWDGTWRGKPQPVGTYVYHIKYGNLFGDVVENNGTVMLLR